MSDPNEIDVWKREVWDAMTPEERGRIIESRRERRRQEHKKKYEAYLCSEQWALLRRLKIEEARGACEVCGERVKLEVHHRDYSRLFRESLADLTALCGVCHELFHEAKRLRELSGDPVAETLHRALAQQRADAANQPATVQGTTR